jgi:NAD(P)H-hydrate epimerase
MPKQGVQAMNASVPEVMTIDLGDEGFLSGTLNIESANAIGFGPGCGTHDDTARLLKSLIQQGKKQFVIDADGLNILSENKTWLSFLSSGTILTPHPGELDRLCGKSNSGFERLEKAKELAIKNSIIVVLKGAYTAVCLPTGEVCFNSTGNPGMAKGGSGDVLTGIISALLAQGLPQINAALLGVYIHGLAGDIAAEKFGEISMTPSDLINLLGEAFSSLHPN